MQSLRPQSVTSPRRSRAPWLPPGPCAPTGGAGDRAGTAVHQSSIAAESWRVVAEVSVSSCESQSLIRSRSGACARKYDCVF